MSDAKEKLVAALTLGRDVHEARSTLLDCLAATGVDMLRRKVGKFEVAIVFPPPHEVTEDADGHALSEAFEQLGKALLVPRPGRRSS